MTLQVCVDLKQHFNSQPHKEADKQVKTKERLQKLFQLTASQGG